VLETVWKGAHGGVAYVCRAKAEQGDFGGGNEGGFGCEGEFWWNE